MCGNKRYKQGTAVGSATPHRSITRHTPAVLISQEKHVNQSNHLLVRNKANQSLRPPLTLSLSSAWGDLLLVPTPAVAITVDPPPPGSKFWCSRKADEVVVPLWHAAAVSADGTWGQTARTGRAGSPGMHTT